MNVMILANNDNLFSYYKGISNEHSDDLYYIVNNKNFSDSDVILIEKDTILEYKEKIKKYINTIDYIFTLEENKIYMINELADYLNAHCLNYSNVVTRNKYEQKCMMSSKGIPTSRGIYFSTYYELKKSLNEYDLTLPVIIKPSNGFSSNGVKLVYTKEELLKEAKNIYMTNLGIYEKEKYDCGILIEEYLQGEEYCFDILLQNKSIIDICIMKKYFDKKSPFADYLYCIDTTISDDFKEETICLANKIVENFEQENGAYHVEFKKDGESLEVIEIAFRPAGASCIYPGISQVMETNFLETYYCIMTGRIVKVKNRLCHFKGERNYFYYLYRADDQKMEMIKKISFNQKKNFGKIDIFSVRNLISLNKKIVYNEGIITYIASIEGFYPSDFRIIEYVNFLNDLIIVE